MWCFAFHQLIIFIDTVICTKDKSVATALFRFYGRLKQFLPKSIRQVVVPYELRDLVVVKHAIESQGVPHTEVGLILANSKSVGFYQKLNEGDFLSVYPGFSSIDISPIQILRPPLANPPRFVIDNHLGHLARHLRLLGFDCLYSDGIDDLELAAISFEQDRVLLTRDRRLLMRKQVTYGFCPLSLDPEKQLLDVVQRYRLRPHMQPWRRCLRCNGMLKHVDKKAIIDRLESKTQKYYHKFQICQDCQQIYWKGSHYPFLDQIVYKFTADN